VIAVITTRAIANWETKIRKSGNYLKTYLDLVYDPVQLAHFDFETLYAEIPELEEFVRETDRIKYDKAVWKARTVIARSLHDNDRGWYDIFENWWPQFIKGSGFDLSCLAPDMCQAEVSKNRYLLKLQIKNYRNENSDMVKAFGRGRIFSVIENILRQAQEAGDSFPDLEEEIAELRKDAPPYVARSHNCGIKLEE